MENYYDATIFHRLVPGFIVQGKERLKASLKSNILQAGIQRDLEWVASQYMENHSKAWLQSLMKIVFLYNLLIGVGPYKKGTFDVSQNLIKTPSGDFKQVSEEF